MKSFLLLLQGYLLGRTGSRVVGVLLLISLVWWAGPYVGLTNETLRLGIIVAILLLILLAWAVRLLLVRRRAGRFQAELQGQSGDVEDDRRFEIEELQKKMNDAVATLKASELGVSHRGSAALYALPWFMIIGPSAAGKTTLLRHSGLHFPYAEEGDIDIRGFGGTRNCDWWFSNEAVLLDTAGRYTTEPGDHGEWKAFLALLRKHRRRMPINGVLVAISLEDLLTSDQAATAQHVKIIRDRIDELTTDLGCLVPVYLVITKCDLLHGFVSFFEDLSEHDRNQVWGAWLGENANPETLVENFHNHLKELYERLCAMRLRKLSMQRRFAAKALIHEFPAEFQVAATRLGEFARLLLKPNPYQETPRFCGVYLTSATQEGTPLQRILGNLRQAFGYVEENAPAKPETTRSYFIKKVFQDIIFANAQAGMKTRRRELLARLLKSTWVTASLALIAGSFMVLSTSLTSNTLLVQRGSAAAEQVRASLVAAEPQPREVLEALDALFAHYRDLRDYERKLPWHLVLGVYQGGVQIDPSRRLLLEGLELNFFQPVARALEFRLENQIRQWETFDEKGREKIRRDFYEDLRTYLMLAQPEHLDTDAALPLLTRVWREELTRGLPQDAEKNFVSDERLGELAAFFLAHLHQQNPAQWAVAPWPARETVVEQAREQLRTPPNAQRLYAQIIGKAKTQVNPRTLEDLIRGYDFGLLNSSFTLPGVFTERAWREFVRPEIAQAVRAASRGDWVIGLQRDPEVEEEIEMRAPNGEYTNPELATRLEKEIRQIYFADYAEAWFGLLESVRIAPFTSLEDASRKILTLARSDGPIGELMRVVSRNINLADGVNPGIEALAAAVEDEQRATRNLVPELDGPLRDLRKFCDPADKMTVSLLVNQYLLAISAMQGEIERLGAAVDVPREAAGYAANILTGGGASSELYKSWVSTTSLLGGIEARTRRVAGNLLMAPLRQSWQVILGQTRKDLQRSWRNSVYAAYGQKVEGRFPFSAQGRDAALVDVTDFFRPEDGVLWDFVNNNLAPFLTRERNGWRQKTWLDQGPGFNRNLLSGLERAQLISASLFRRGSDEPEVQFYLYPMPSRGLSEMYLESNGQHYRYRNEPQEWRQFRWPGDMGRLGARIHGLTGLGTGRAELGFEGVWGIFHLLDRADLTVESGTHYLSVWDLDDGNGRPVTVQFRIRADRENNIFERGLFSKLNLPESIF
ncbi:type VI secretion system protein ImpL [Geoalkalibacter ferrihydriticus]|uniref:Type VI secretion protein IcmF n=2 Tax=Geoalkalibacter ferrihydriticus TaxID=392333 RepID=A0A0C2HUN4_9BACT|nr:type VI secretion system membrane subunit TssM [Geoalkalibacter ferrihydriticus]KIH76527.1 hypothetical protein GFER_10135 [Geoalkalibacter ferrihydriticus DSM 17813]SDL99859.1 type VI secretion system protein ImpL [Geoalkalibacter ferrihydriticus]